MNFKKFILFAAIFVNIVTLQQGAHAAFQTNHKNLIGLELMAKRIATTLQNAVPKNFKEFVELILKFSLKKTKIEDAQEEAKALVEEVATAYGIQGITPWQIDRVSAFAIDAFGQTPAIALPSSNTLKNGHKSSSFDDFPYKLFRPGFNNFAAYHEGAHLFHGHDATLNINIMLMITFSATLAQGAYLMPNFIRARPLFFSSLIGWALGSINSQLRSGMEREADLTACDFMIKKNHADTLIDFIASGRVAQSSDKFIRIEKITSALCILLSLKDHPDLPERFDYLEQCLNNHGYNTTREVLKRRCTLEKEGQMLMIAPGIFNPSQLLIHNSDGPDDIIQQNATICDDKRRLLRLNSSSYPCPCDEFVETAAPAVK